ncbi:MAG: penicillin-binding transpeptidase domain-containing protein [Fibrobacterota bacterium]
MQIRKDMIDGIYLDRLSKSKVLISFFVVLFTIILMRVAFIQIERGERYLKLSRENRLSREMIRSERGLIYDRYGRIIARNRPSYSLYIIPDKIPPRPSLIDQLTQLKTQEGKAVFKRKQLKKQLAKQNTGKSLPLDGSVLTEKDLFRELCGITDKQGRPLFKEEPLRTLLDSVEIPSASIVASLRSNSLSEVKKRLLKITDRTGEALLDTSFLEERLNLALQAPSSKTMIAEDISMESVSIIEEHSTQLPGITIEIESRREYPYGEALFHVLGYISEIDRKTLKKREDLGYHRGNKVGRQGIEAEYDTLLHGKKGWCFVERNSIGTNLGILEDMPYIAPTAGKNIYLTIDAELQKRIAEQFSDTLRGAVIAMNPKNGEVYCLYSNPSFDANSFSLSEKKVGKKWHAASRDAKRPLVNNAINGKYPPGSTFKLITALAGLDQGIVTPDEHLEKPCNGGLAYGNNYFSCWKESGHGYTNVYDAIKSSCNVYFYQLGLKLGYDGINDAARAIQLGKRTGIDIPNEGEGYLSGKKEHNIRHAGKGPGWLWTNGLVLNQAIGQSQELTPMEILLIPSAFNPQQRLYTPRLLKEVRSPQNAFISRPEKETLADYSFDSTAMAAVREGMYRVVNAPGGTGWRTRMKYIPVGGKSGSSENPHGDKTHAVFVASAPLDNPEIAVVAVLANAGHGGSVAAPFVKTVLEYYFSETEEGRTTRNKYQQLKTPEKTAK